MTAQRRRIGADFLRTETGDLQAARNAGQADRFFGTAAVQPGGKEAADEGIAGAGGVDELHRQRWRTQHGTLGEHGCCAVLAQRHDDDPRPRSGGCSSEFTQAADAGLDIAFPEPELLQRLLVQGTDRKFNRMRASMARVFGPPSVFDLCRLRGRSGPMALPLGARRLSACHTRSPAPQRV